MRLLSPQSRRTLSANKWRYLSLVAGFFLFVAPLALFTRLVYALTGNTATATLHSICYRMPFDWLLGGRYLMLWGSVAAVFVLAVVVVSYFAGPVFCGWLCPVGAISEGLSRIAPLPDKLRLKPGSSTSSGLRWGFLAGFASVSLCVGSRLFGGSLGSICCRFCSSSVLQNCAYASTGDTEAVDYWSSGSMLALGAWLGLGGLFLRGGRGWCLFFCPLGAISNLAHRLGARRGWLATRFKETSCRSCPTCSVGCPAGALRPDRSVDLSLCMNCYECTHSCAQGAYECTTMKQTGEPTPALELVSR